MTKCDLDIRNCDTDKYALDSIEGTRGFTKRWHDSKKHVKAIISYVNGSSFHRDCKAPHCIRSEKEVLDLGGLPCSIWYAAMWYTITGWDHSLYCALRAAALADSCNVSTVVRRYRGQGSSSRNDFVCWNFPC